MLHCELSIFLVADWGHFNPISMSWPLVFWILLQHFLEEMTVWTVWLWEAWDSRSPPPTKKKTARYVLCLIGGTGKSNRLKTASFQVVCWIIKCRPFSRTNVSGKCKCHKAFTLPCLISNYLRRFRPIWLLFQLGWQPKTQIGLGAMQSHSHVGKNVQLTKTPPPPGMEQPCTLENQASVSYLMLLQRQTLAVFSGCQIQNSLLYSKTTKPQRMLLTTGR